MMVIDSSFWIEFCNGTNYGKIIKDNDDFIHYKFIVPTIVVFEVYKKLLLDYQSDVANFFVANLQYGKIEELDLNLALFAAEISKNCKLPMADSIIYATAQKSKATLYTMDKHFKDLPGVKYFEKV